MLGLLSGSWLGVRVKVRVSVLTLVMFYFVVLEN